MSFPTKLLNDGEHVVVSTRAHPKALVVPVLLVIVVLSPVTAMFSLDGTGATVAWSFWGVLGLVGLVLAARSFVEWATTSYTFTNRRFIKRSGLIAKEGRTIPLNRISGVDFEIDLLDRILGCGTLIVSDASTHGRVLLDDIPRVEEVQLRVAEELHTLSSGGPTSERVDDGA